MAPVHLKGYERFSGKTMGRPQDRSSRDRGGEVDLQIVETSRNLTQKEILLSTFVNNHTPKNIADTYTKLPK